MEGSSRGKRLQHKARIFFSNLGFELCVQVGFEGFLMTLQDAPSVARFHNLEREGDKPNCLVPTSKGQSLKLHQAYRFIGTVRVWKCHETEEDIYKGNK